MQLSQFEVLDDMLIGDLKVVQDTRLYRFTSDSVLLTKFATVKTGDVVADFCSGCGIVGFHLHALYPDKKFSFTLFEMQKPLSELAKKTIEYNRFENFKTENIRLQEIPSEYNGKFSLVVCNPPYERGGLENETYEKAVCRKEITITLEEIVAAAKKVVKFGGRFALIHRADRVAEVCYTLKKYNFEVKKLQFVAGTGEKKPYLVMVEATLGGKPCVNVLPTLVNEGE